MITDEKNPSVAEQLSSNPVIGPYFQVVASEVSTVTGDMISYIFSRRDGDKWETFCSSDEACFYTWQQIRIEISA